MTAPDDRPPLIVERVEPPSRGRALVQLLRLPNVFTAVADVAMGFLMTHVDVQPWPQLATLVTASCCLYLAGMVLNDFFDRQIDAVERPCRPVPSGRVSIGFARRLGFGLLAAGMGAGVLASVLAHEWRSALVAAALAGAVVLYDGWLKRTPLGPLGMGACRLLNVLLGMSAADGPWQPMHGIVATGVGVYIAGVTWFARKEAGESRRATLAAALVVILSGIGLLAWYPRWATAELPEVSWPAFALRAGDRWSIFWIVMALLIGWRAARAIVDPLPGNVQAAVKHCLISLILLDAAVCLGVRGPFYGCAMVALVFPMMLLGRWSYST